MTMSESRRRKLQMLTQSLARGDFDAARNALRPGAAKAGAGGLKSAGKFAGPEADEGADAGGLAAIVLPELPQGPMELPLAIPGSEWLGEPAAAGRFWLVRRTLEEIAPQHVSVQDNYDAVLRGARQRLDELQASAELCHVANARPEDLLFMDIETCGLAGTAIFLVGTMFFAEGRLVFEQLLARDYSEEQAILRAFADKLDAAGVLVTFNGRSFDMNQIRERCVFHQLDSCLPDSHRTSPPRRLATRPPHLDLLPESRKRWRKRLPNCRLQTLERVLCNRRRVGDIPGWAIPDAYHQFVATGDARQLRDIVHHNMLDLLTMAELLTAILTGVDVE